MALLLPRRGLVSVREVHPVFVPRKPAVILPFRRQLKLTPLGCITVGPKGTRFSPGFLYPEVPALTAAAQGQIDNASGTSTTFGTFTFGSANVTRTLIASIYIPSSTTTISTVTIGGVTASILASASLTGLHPAIASALVTTGTTGSVVVTMSGSSTQVSSCFLYSLINDAHITTVDTVGINNGGSGALTHTFTYSAKGPVISMAMANISSAPTFTGTGQVLDGQRDSTSNHCRFFSAKAPTGTVTTSIGNVSVANSALVGVAIKPT